MKSVKDVFPELLFMPTGGIDNNNLESWFRAGASAVGMGSSLITRAIVENREFDNLRDNTGAVLNQIANIKSIPA